jgi:hydrogenase maturation protease
MEEEQKPVLVLGVGNVLLQDEGIGVHVIHRLLRLELPDEVEVVDGGTAGFDLLAVVEGRRRIIVVDAVKTDQDPPGSIYRLSPENLQPTFQGKSSIHQVEFLDVLGMAAMMSSLPETVIFGVVPREFERFGLEPTPEVKAKIPALVEFVLRELGLDPAAVREKETPPPSDLPRPTLEIDRGDGLGELEE